MRIWPIVALLLMFQRFPGQAQTELPPANPPYHRVRYEASATPGQLVYGVSYTLWIPPGVRTLRGIIVHQHGCGDGACRGGQTAAYDLHWQALAKKHGCALMGPSYEQPDKADCTLWCDPRNGSDEAFQKSLADLGVRTNHPELSKIPWALWGHSGGAMWAGNMLMMHPDRVLAVWLRSGTPRLTPIEGRAPALEIPAGAYSVPVVVNLGIKERDDRFAGVWKSGPYIFNLLREKGGLVAFAPDPNSSHDCGNSRYLAIPWFDACLTDRLPRKAGSSELRPMPTRATHLAEYMSQTAMVEAKFVGSKTAASWLPNERVAKVWEQYVKDGKVADTTAPPAPFKVRLEGEVLKWECEADFESGLGGFIVERDGVEIGRVPEKPGGIGSPIFQRNSYHDTPSNPLMEMKLHLPSADSTQKHSYRIYAINGVGLRSRAATLVR